MTVDPARAAGRVDYEGQTYYFCGRGCVEKFRANPAAFIRPRPEQARAAPTAVDAREYTCPMHPQVRQIGPGSCPICGMALEPVTATLDEHPNEELVDMSRRFRVSAALTAPLLLLAMGEYVPGPLARISAVPWFPWLGLALATPVVIWGAWPFVVRGWMSVVNRSLNMFTLIALGVSVAYIYSVVATVFPGWFPSSVRDDMGRVGVYFEVSAAIVTLILLGQVLELRARSQTGAAIRNLLGMAAKFARRIRDDGTEEDVRQAHEAGFAAHLTKPVSVERLEETIRSVGG